MDGVKLDNDFEMYLNEGLEIYKENFTAYSWILYHWLPWIFGFYMEQYADQMRELIKCGVEN